jgi:hypothetical protein
MSGDTKEEIANPGANQGMGMFGGYSNLRDMVNGGGPGKSGQYYSGAGPLSAAGNFVRNGGILGALFGGNGLGGFADTRTSEERLADWVAYERENSGEWMPPEQEQATTPAPPPPPEPQEPVVPYVPPAVEVPSMFGTYTPGAQVPTYTPNFATLPTDFSLYGQNPYATSNLSFALMQQADMPQQGIGSLMRFADGGMVRGYQAGGDVFSLSPEERDILIRTIIGEAGGESPLGQAAVAHVILNRARSDRYPGSPAAVATQGSDGRYAQFSAWNTPENGGNTLPQSVSPNDSVYQQVGAVLDQVLAGEIPDPTGGATHYYSPAGMPGRRAPSWWEDEVARGGGVTEIGTHRFAGPGDGTGSVSMPDFETEIRNDTSGGIAPAQSAQQPRRGGLLGGIFGGGGDSLGGNEGAQAQLDRIQRMLDEGRISEGTADILAARAIQGGGEDRRSGFAMGLSDLSDYLVNNAPERPRNLSASVLRGRGGSGASAVQRFGVRPLGTAGG